MTDARQRTFWHRAGPLVAAAGLIVAAGANEGCGPGEGSTGGGGTGGTSSHHATTGTTSTTTSTSTTSSTGTGGMFGGMVTPAADAFLALDATPDPAGTTLYFTAVDPITRDTGVFKAPADGSSITAPTAIKVGAPFTAPYGITISTDGAQLYIADPGALDMTSNKDGGVIFSMPVGGGTPTILSGTELTSARSVDLVKEGTADVLYFTGRDKTDGSPGVFKIPASGGAVSKIATMAPFNDPSGLAVAADGTVYVADTVAAASQRASIIKVTKAGVASVLFPELRTGYPAGLALSKDGKTLYVSALDPLKLTDQILEIDVSNGMMLGINVNGGIDANYEAGGIHRAHNADIFAWADTSAGPAGGRVYTIK